MLSALTPIQAYKPTSTAGFEIGIAVELVNNSTIFPTATVTIIPCLRRVDKTEYRHQHIWNSHFSVDHVHKISYLGKTLPDNNTKPSVNGEGGITMERNVWYQWGPSYSFTMNNDGKLHYAGVYLHCESAIPRYCPDLSTYLECNFRLPLYRNEVIPSDPVDVRATFDEDTRVLRYTWNTVGVKNNVMLLRNFFDEEDTVVYSGYFPNPVKVGSTELSDAQMLEGLIVDTIPDDVAKITFEVINVSSTGKLASSGIITVNVPTNDKVWVKVNGVWKKAVPWVKVNGVWKKVPKVYVRVNGVWKRTKM